MFWSQRYGNFLSLFGQIVCYVSRKNFPTSGHKLKTTLSFVKTAQLFVQTTQSFIQTTVPFEEYLPTYETKNPYTPRVPPTPLSINTHSYFQEFVWRVPTTKDSQGDDVRFSLHQKVEIDYGICYSVTHFDQTVGPDAYMLEEYVETIRDSSVIDLIPPCRIPMGTLKITNQNKGQYVTQIAIAKKGQQPQVVSKGSVAYGKSFEIFLDVGQYDVTFKMGTTSKNVKTYKLGYDFAEINKDEVLELFSDFDFIPL